MSRSEPTQTLATHTLPAPRTLTAGFEGRLREGSPGARSIILSLPLPALVVVALALESDPLAMVAGMATIGVAVVVPAVGLLELAFLAPLLGRPILPYPGLMALLLAAVILGSIYRLSIDRPTLRVPIALAVILSFLLFVVRPAAPGDD